MGSLRSQKMVSPPDRMADGCDREELKQNQSLLALTSALPLLCTAATSPLLATAAKGWRLCGIENHSLSSHCTCQLIENFHISALFDFHKDPLQMPWPMTEAHLLRHGP